MPIKHVDQTEVSLKAWFVPSGRWLYGLIGLPILASGMISAISIFDRVDLGCDRSTDLCMLNTRNLLRTDEQSFKFSEIKGVRRNIHKVGLLLAQRDITLWHDQFRWTPDLNSIERALRSALADRDAQILVWSYGNYRDGLILTLVQWGLGGFWSLWMGRQSYLLMNRPEYRVKLVQFNGFPLWWRSHSVDQVQKFSLEPTKTALGQDSFEAQMLLNSGKIVPLTTVDSFDLGTAQINQLNGYLRETPKPIPVIQPSLSQNIDPQSPASEASPLGLPAKVSSLFKKSSTKSMSLRLYNALSRQKEDFQTLEPNKVRMYCCGVTVYDYCHLGHARSYIVWDVVRRYLMWLGLQVRYVQNFTDIDDKILKRAAQEESSMEAVSEKYIEAYYEDMDRLNILRADEYPRATHTLDGIKRLIHELEQKGVAYAADGDVYYSVRKFDDYGKLSGRKLDDMQAGASGRVDAPKPDAEKKKDPFDFALWKAAKPGEPSWDSDWGNGRPGWHIECSAMVRDRLGDSIDIHMGGADLCFPHHENEIAQSEGATGQQLSTYWMHNGMVNVGGEKMSKSLGNFTTIRDLLDNPLPALDGQTFNPMALRLFVLQAQYRKPIDFTDEAVKAAQQSWSTLKDGLLFGWNHGKDLEWDEMPTPEASLPIQILATDDSAWVERFRKAMDDDFNATEALAVLFELAKNLKRASNLISHDGKADQSSDELKQQWTYLVGLAGVLGLQASPEKEDESDSSGLSDDAIAALIEERTAAKANKDYAAADRIRDELKDQGIQLIDKPGGVTDWIRE